ncbi:dephospho-CoA kinase [Ligilactobacillus sp. Marseille-Q7487]|uniref:dephospho-CoA kinase n=1 Tax=Ligilactobacillus sp. Marseille-Q7487 TaxID=3022128 RepID=UPI0024A8FD47|nr:dephospho-CoA kinase [Ligilactobacillus sp. Marseille-Q7487]
MTYILGLTGGIATGKSTVSAYLKTKGAQIIDADLLAREVVKPKTKGWQEIIAVFGNEVLSADLTLNRQKLGQLVFADAAKLKQLNQITGPLIHALFLQEIAEAKKRDVRLLVLDIPLLFENNYQQLCDSVMVLTIPEKLQIQRVMKRDNLTMQQARQRIASQMPDEQKRKLADVVIDSSQQPSKTCLAVQKWLDLKNLIK